MPAVLLDKPNVTRTPKDTFRTGRTARTSHLHQPRIQESHYHIHYHYPCKAHAQHKHSTHARHTSQTHAHPTPRLTPKSQLNYLRNVNPSSPEFMPLQFAKGGHGTARVEWSRHNTPEKGGNFRLKWSKHRKVIKYKGKQAPPGTGVGDKRMGKTKTETTTRTFTKNGTRYEETVEVVTKEDSDGNVTKTTKTTTKALDPYSTTEMAAAINDPKTSRKGHRKSSSSSSSPSPDRAKSSGASAKETGKSSKSGFRIKLRSGKTDDGDSSDDDDDFAKGVHKKVNHYRSKHGVSNLKLNKEMNKYAKEWAKKMAADDALSHRPDSKYGENVFCLSSNTKDFKVKADQVVDKWYDESKEHKFGVEPQGTVLKSGHFTQMVWKDTKQMGVGKARSAAGTKVFVVANFDPQGNWMGQFADQVPPVGGFPKPASSGKTSLFSSKTHKSSSDSDSSDDDDFAEECLKSHNNYRAKHGAPPLKLSKKLSKYAHEWAQTIAKKDVLQHRQNNSYGENLYCAWSSNPKHMIKGSEAVESWYQEIKDFTFGREPSDLRAGHFTQVVWLDSEELGVATARSKSGKIYVVANYSPAGNFVGSFATKVPRPK
ncbi:uncharacterized protein [Cherax quadricarinatus]|uniref:uncharacterized protein isoform X2 n=1 Tax=Cherax quadricarinatus TaxID=27406 RepID=UPI00387E7FF2